MTPTELVQSWANAAIKPFHGANRTAGVDVGIRTTMKNVFAVGRKLMPEIAGITFWLEWDDESQIHVRMDEPPTGGLKVTV